MRDTVLAFFASENIDVQSAQDSVLRVSFQGENGRFQAFARVDESTGVFALYAVSPVSAPPARMSEACELVARLNFGHKLGNLELDVESGEIRMKTSIDVEGEELTEGLVANVVYANVASLDQMLPAIVACLTKGATPKAAVAAIAGA
jgi:hypothetical protein